MATSQSLLNGQQDNSCSVDNEGSVANSSTGVEGGHEATKRHIIWEDMFDELQAIRDKTGSCNLPDKKGPLAKWVYAQRKAFRRVQNNNRGNPTTRARLEKLKAIGFEFSSSSYVPWDVMFEKYKRRDSAEIAANPDERRKLKLWMSNQRLEYSRERRGLLNNITQERIAKLDSVGFQWVGRTGKPAASSSLSKTAARKKKTCHDDSSTKEQLQEQCEGNPRTKKRKRLERQGHPDSDSGKRQQTRPQQDVGSDSNQACQDAALSHRMNCYPLVCEEDGSVLEVLTAMKHGHLKTPVEGISSVELLRSKSRLTMIDERVKHPTETAITTTTRIDEVSSTTETLMTKAGDEVGNTRPQPIMSHDDHKTRCTQFISMPCSSSDGRSWCTGLLIGRDKESRNVGRDQRRPKSNSKQQPSGCCCARRIRNSGYHVTTTKSPQSRNTAVCLGAKHGEETSHGCVATRDSTTTMLLPHKVCHDNASAEHFFADPRFFSPAMLGAAVETSQNDRRDWSSSRSTVSNRSNKRSSGTPTMGLTRSNTAPISSSSSSSSSNSSSSPSVDDLDYNRMQIQHQQHTNLPVQHQCCNGVCWDASKYLHNMSSSLSLSTTTMTAPEAAAFLWSGAGLLAPSYLYDPQHYWERHPPIMSHPSLFPFLAARCGCCYNGSGDRGSPPSIPSSQKISRFPVFVEYAAADATQDLESS